MRVWRALVCKPLIDVPEMAFAMIDGHGDPNTTGCDREAIDAPYTVAYAVKFAVKRAAPAIEFAVMPLRACGGATT